MKTFAIILLFNLITLTNYAQNPGSILYVEEFESSSTPYGWETFNDATSSGTYDWIFDATNMPTGANFTNGAAIFDDYAAGNTGLHDRRHLRMTVPIDLTDYENAHISFTYALQENAGAGKLIVSIGQGSNWYIFQEYQNSTNPTYVDYDIESFLTTYSIPRDNVRIGFIYDDENSGQNWGAGISSLRVYAYPINIASNDLCENAIDVTNDLVNTSNFNLSQETNGAVFGNNETCNTEYGADGVWYKFTAPSPGIIHITASPYYWDNAIQTYSGSCNDLTCIHYTNDSGVNENETQDLIVESGEDYYINISIWSTFIENYSGLLNTNMSWVNTTSVTDTVIDGLKIFPNPAENILNLSTTNSIESIEISNLLGQTVLTTKPNSNAVQLMIEGIRPGSYIIKIKAGDQIGNYKLLKK